KSRTPDRPCTPSRGAHRRPGRPPLRPADLSEVSDPLRQGLSAEKAGHLRQGRREAHRPPRRPARRRPQAHAGIRDQDRAAHWLLQGARRRASDRRSGYRRRGGEAHPQSAGLMAGGIEIKTSDEIAYMREASLILWEVLEELE